MGPLSRPNNGSGHWSQSPFGSFQSAARLAGQNVVPVDQCLTIRLFGTSFAYKNTIGGRHGLLNNGRHSRHKSK